MVVVNVVVISVVAFVDPVVVCSCGRRVFNTDNCGLKLCMEW